MPRVSRKRKARSETGRLNAEKRWKQDVATGSHSSLPPTSPPSPPPPSPTPAGLTSASYRHSLLPQRDREAHEISEDSVMVTISLIRLQSLLRLVKCSDCGKQVVSEVTTEYFDCTITLRCDECEKIVHQSEPKKCENSDFSEGNVIQVCREGVRRKYVCVGRSEGVCTSTTTSNLPGMPRELCDRNGLNMSVTAFGMDINMKEEMDIKEESIEMDRNLSVNEDEGDIAWQEEKRNLSISQSQESTPNAKRQYSQVKQEETRAKVVPIYPTAKILRDESNAGFNSHAAHFGFDINVKEEKIDIKEEPIEMNPNLSKNEDGDDLLWRAEEKNLSCSQSPKATSDIKRQHVKAEEMETKDAPMYPAAKIPGRQGRASQEALQRLTGDVSFHCPVHVPPTSTRPHKMAQRECIACKKTTKRGKKRKLVTTMCRGCNVGLCLGDCFDQYHSLQEF